MVKKMDMFCNLCKLKVYLHGFCYDWMPDDDVNKKHRCSNCFHSRRLKDDVVELEGQTMKPKDYILDYWIEAVETSLEDMGKLAGFSDVEIKSMAEDMCTSADCQNMAFGSNMAENPLTEEIKELKNKYNKATNESDKRERILFDHITKCHSDLSVSIKHGQVWFE